MLLAVVIALAIALAQSQLSCVDRGKLAIVFIFFLTNYPLFFIMIPTRPAV